MHQFQALSKICSTLFLFLILLFHGSSEARGTEITSAEIVVDVSQNVTVIEKTTLPGYDTGVVNLTILRSVLHGTLGSTDPSALQLSEKPLTYAPTPEFWSLGSDSFSYRLTRGDGSQQTSTVLLVAGRHRGQRVCHQDFENNGVVTIGEWSAVGGPVAHADAAITGDWGVRNSVPDLKGQPDSSVRCDPPVITQAHGVRVVVGVSNPPEYGENLTADILVLSAGNDGGDAKLELWMTAEEGVYNLYARIWDPVQLNWVVTGNWPVGAGPHKLSLDWWPNDDTVDQVGGLALWGDQTFIDRMFTTQYFDPDDLTFTFGIQGFSQEPLTLDLDDLEVWLGDVESSVDVLLVDGFENGDPDPWIPGPGTVVGLSVDQAAAITGDYGLESNLAMGYGNLEYLMDDDPIGRTSYAARFLVDTRSSAMELNDMVLLLDLLDQNSLGGATEHLKVTLRKHSGGSTFRLLGRARDGSALAAGSWNNSVNTVVSDGVHTVELLWKAASRPGLTDGYLRLWLDGVPVPGVSGLANHGRTVESAILGTLGINSGSTGFLYLDDFEAWSEKP